jgi:hypothetical protein
MALFATETAASISEFTDVLRRVFAPAPPAAGAVRPGAPTGDAAAAGTASPHVSAGGSLGAAGAVDSIYRWFRGQANVGWNVVPSLARPPHRIDAEQALIKRFRQNAYALLPNPPKTNWEWMFLMQHHGAPTRLVDWTENALCALYFAVAEDRHLGVDGAVWCLDPVGLNKAAYVQPTGGSEFLFFGMDEELDLYDTEGLAKPNKPPVAALAPRYFPRIAAQSGVFTIHHREPEPLNHVHGGAYVGQIVIPTGAKKQLIADLAVLGIRKLTLFPELDAVAALAKEVF